MWLGRFSPVYRRSVLSYLSRYFPERIALDDMVRILSSDNPGRRHLQLALRCYFNFLDEVGYASPEVLERFRRVVKVERAGIDNYCPDDSTVREAYGRLRKPGYKLAFRILAFSGIRLRETVKFLETFEARRVERYGDVSLYPLPSVRGMKTSFYVFLPSSLMDEVKPNTLSYDAVEQSLFRAGLPSKYLRKWNYNKLIDHMPESLADFIQGRSIISIGGLHYLDKKRKAVNAYKKAMESILLLLDSRYVLS